jgi:hypothetical protein
LLQGSLHAIIMLLKSDAPLSGVWQAPWWYQLNRQIAAVCSLFDGIYCLRCYFADIQAVIKMLKLARWSRLRIPCLAIEKNIEA